MADEKRGVNVTLRVDQEGDVDAFDKIAGDIERVDAAAGSGTGFEDLQERLRQSKERLDELEGSLSGGGGGGKGGGGGGILSALSKGEKAFVTAAAVVGTFSQAWDTTREVVDFFKETFGVDIDAIVSDALELETAATSILGLGTTVEETATLLQNQQKIFDNLNLDGFTNNVDKNAEILAQSFQKISQDAQKSAEAKKRVEDFLDGIGLSAENAQKRADALGKQLLEVFQLKPDIDKEAFQAAVGGMVDAALEELKRAKAEIPASLQAVVDEFGLLPQKLQATEQGITQAVQAIIRGMQGAADPAPIFEQVTNINEALAQIAANMDGESSAKVTAELQRMVDAARAGGEKLDPATAEVAAKFGVIVSAIDVLGFDATIKPLDDVATKVGDIGQKADTAATAQSNAATAAGEQAKGLAEIAKEDVGPAAAKAIESIGKASGELSNLQFSSEIVRQLKEIKAEADAAKAALDSINTAGTGGGAAPAPAAPQAAPQAAT